MVRYIYGPIPDRCSEREMQDGTLFRLGHLCGELSKISATVRNETNEVVATTDHVEIIKHYDSLRRVTAAIKESREILAQLEEKLSREQVPEAMRAHNVRTITVEGVGRVSLGTRWSASMPDKQAGFEWLRANEHGGVIQETVNAQTLGALAKELNEEGMDLPAPTFVTNIMTYTSITKVK